MQELPVAQRTQEQAKASQPVRTLAGWMSIVQLCLSEYYQHQHTGQALHLLLPAVPALASPLPAGFSFCATAVHSCALRNRLKTSSMTKRQIKRRRRFYGVLLAVHLCRKVKMCLFMSFHEMLCVIGKKPVSWVDDEELQLQQPCKTCSYWICPFCFNVIVSFDL